MTTLNLIPGDYDINSQGHHICNDQGFAIVLTEEKQVEIPNQDDYDRILIVTEGCRIARGLNTDGSEIVTETPVEP